MLNEYVVTPDERHTDEHSQSRFRTGGRCVNVTTEMNKIMKPRIPVSHQLFPNPINQNASLDSQQPIIFHEPGVDGMLKPSYIGSARISCRGYQAHLTSGMKEYVLIRLFPFRTGFIGFTELYLEYGVFEYPTTESRRFVRTSYPSTNRNARQD